MRAPQRAVLAAVLALALGALPARADPAWQCRVCEDAMQSWHDQFRCAGHFLDWGDPLSPDIRGCEGPQFDCNKLAGKLRGACLSMMNVFMYEPLYARKIWENMMLTNDAYKTCQELGRCAPDPDPVTPSDCHRDFMDESCGKNPTCTNFTRNCEESCYLCNWLVRDWPLFQEVCKPLGAELPQSVPLPTDKLPTSFLETVASTRGHKRSAVGERLARVGAGAQSQTLNPAHDIAQLAAIAAQQQRQRDDGEGRVTSLQSGYTLPQECFRMWNEIRVSMKARYFASWKNYVGVQQDTLDRLNSNMWDANVACKCLGRCDLNRFEDLGLLESCRYEAADERMMQYVFMYEAQLRAAKRGDAAPAAAASADQGQGQAQG